MIITNEFLTESLMNKYMEDSKAEIASSYILTDFSQHIEGFSMDTCVDIGSNFGIFSINASVFFKNVYAFEPSYLPELTSKIFIENLGIRNIKIFNLAVTNKTGQILPLTNIPCPDGLRLSKDNTLLLNPKSEKIKNQYELVLTIAYKDIFELIEKESIDYLKIDCEGCEYLILLNQDLSNVGIISGEMHNLPGFDFDVLQSSLTNHLAKYFYVCMTKHNFIALNRKYCTPENLENFLNVLEARGWKNKDTLEGKNS